MDNHAEQDNRPLQVEVNVGPWFFSSPCSEPWTIMPKRKAARPLRTKNVRPFVFLLYGVSTTRKRTDRRHGCERRAVGAGSAQVPV